MAGEAGGTETQTLPPSVSVPLNISTMVRQEMTYIRNWMMK